MFYKKKSKHKNKHKKFTAASYKKGLLGPLQMMEIANTVISKKRLFVFTESL